MVHIKIWKVVNAIHKYMLSYWVCHFPNLTTCTVLHQIMNLHLQFIKVTTWKKPISAVVQIQINFDQIISFKKYLLEIACESKWVLPQPSGYHLTRISAAFSIIRSETSIYVKIISCYLNAIANISQIHWIFTLREAGRKYLQKNSFKARFFSCSC